MRPLFYLLLFFLPLSFAFHLNPADKEPESSPPPLVSAAEEGNLLLVEDLLADTGSADLRDSCYWTPLMKAALNGHEEVVRRLLSHGVDVNAEDKGGYTALMLAASNNHVGIVELLIEAGADVDHRERTRGWTALEWALRAGHDDMVRLLKARGGHVSTGQCLDCPPRNG